jgi:GDP-L-fucose synthase
MNLDTKIFIAGHSGLVGNSCVDLFRQKGYSNIVSATSGKLDLRDQLSTYDFLNEEQPQVIINAAAKVGGILANEKHPYEFLLDNMLIQNNLINGAHKFDVPKFIFLGSSCIYPKHAPQPLRESCLLTNSLEPTNQWYAIAKISGVKLIEALREQYGRKYVTLMPTNLYGPGDNFNLQSSHVLPAMIRKFHEAKLKNHAAVELWGTGSPRREFLHSSDVANAIFFALSNGLPEAMYNVGSGIDFTIKEIAKMVQDIVEHKGEIIWDDTKPDGTPRKLLDVSKLFGFGWQPKIELSQGINETYNWFLKNMDELR